MIAREELKDVPSNSHSLGLARLFTKNGFELFPGLLVSDMVDTRHVFSSAEVIFGDLVRFVRSRSILL